MSTQDSHIGGAQSPPLDVAIDPAVAAFVDEVEKFLVRWAVPASRFGREACNDSRFVRDLRNGREVDYRTRVRVKAWMDDYERGRAADDAAAPEASNDTPLGLRAAS